MNGGCQNSGGYIILVEDALRYCSGVSTENHPPDGFLVGHRSLSLASISAEKVPRTFSSHEMLVGETGFEPATLCSQSRCATRLRYSPTLSCAPRGGPGRIRTCDLAVMSGQL